MNNKIFYLNIMKYEFTRLIRRDFFFFMGESKLDENLVHVRQFNCIHVKEKKCIVIRDIMNS